MSTLDKTQQSAGGLKTSILDTSQEVVRGKDVRASAVGHHRYYMEFITETSSDGHKTVSRDTPCMDVSARGNGKEQ